MSGPCRSCIDGLSDLGGECPVCDGTGRSPHEWDDDFATDDEMTVTLDCGHVATVPHNPHLKPGAWLSCWALCWPSQDSCQTQRKVIEVTP